MQNVLAMVLSTTLLSATADAEGLCIARQGRSDCQIVVAPEHDAVVATAARELADHLEQVTGARLEVLTADEAPADGGQILVGPSDRLRRLLPELKLDELGHDGIVMKTVGSNLVLAGRPPRGTLYAVYTFLEDVVGCRWWTSTESFIPRQATLTVPALDVAYAPPLRYREAFYRDAFQGVFAARLKCNGHFSQVPPEYGGHDRFAGYVHTFYPLLPPSKYFDEHPEWYSEIDGKRTHERAQLCLTNEAMREELVKNVLARLRKEPDAALVSISQNDWHGRCQCPACQAVEEEEGSPAGPLLRFVNAVAEEVEKEFPDVLVETLAYQYTRKPPKRARPRDNVVIRLCSIECSFLEPLGEGPQNEPFRSDIEGWSEIAPRLFVWDYVTNFSNYILPHPNLRVLGPNIRFFVDHNVVGLFEQGDSQSNVGDFIRLRAWLLAHLMWDPSADEEALIEQFMTGYYGPAAPHLIAYLNVLHDAAERSDVYLRCFLHDTAGWLTLDDLNRATRLYEKAEEAVADDPVLSARVRRERMPLDHVWLKRYYALRRAARYQGKEFLGPDDPVAACEEFIRLAHELKAGNYRERRPFSEYEAALRGRFRPAGPPPEMCRELAEDDWIDFQDNQFRLAQPGTWAALVDDAAASDKKAARMPGDHYEWAVACPLSDDLADAGPWKCYVVARCEAEASEGPAMTMGIYDSRAKKGVAHRRIDVGASAGSAYHVFDLGTHPVHGGLYFWVAPPKRPGEVKAVYIDRIFMVREKDAR